MAKCRKQNCPTRIRVFFFCLFGFFWGFFFFWSVQRHDGRKLSKNISFIFFSFFLLSIWPAFCRKNNVQKWQLTLFVVKQSQTISLPSWDADTRFLKQSHRQVSSGQSLLGPFDPWCHTMQSTGCKQGRLSAPGTRCKVAVYFRGPIHDFNVTYTGHSAPWNSAA